MKTRSVEIDYDVVLQECNITAKSIDAVPDYGGRSIRFVPHLCELGGENYPIVDRFTARTVIDAISIYFYPTLEQWIKDDEKNKDKIKLIMYRALRLINSSKKTYNIKKVSELKEIGGDYFFNGVLHHIDEEIGMTLIPDATGKNPHAEFHMFDFECDLKKTEDSDFVDYINSCRYVMRMDEHTNSPLLDETRADFFKKFGLSGQSECDEKYGNVYIFTDEGEDVFFATKSNCKFEQVRPELC